MPEDGRVVADVGSGRPPDRRSRDGRDARRRRHPRAHRRPEGQRRAEAVARGPARRAAGANRVLRSGTGGLVPSTFATGYRYSLLGYTTVVEAAAPPLAARHVLAELRDTPMIDKAFLILMGNNQVLFELIRESGPPHVSPRLRDAVAWWLEATGGYGVKLVNPGGVELWKQNNGAVESLDDAHRGFRGDAAPSDRGDRRCGRRTRLAAPGPRPRQQPRRAPATRTRHSTRCATLVGRQAHFAHLQFHSYGGKPEASRARARPS